jgi:hypothetical protein
MPTIKPFVAEGVGFEPTEHLSMFNGFQVLRRSCYLVRLVLSSAVLSSVLCCPVRLVLSCNVQFWLQLVYKPRVFASFSEPRGRYVCLYVPFSKRRAFDVDLLGTG